MHFKRYAVFAKRRGVQQAVLYRHAGIVGGVPQKGGRSIAANKPFRRKRFLLFGGGAEGIKGERVPVQNLAVVKIDAENNLIAIKGAIPGAKGGIVTITDSVKA